MTTVAVLGTGIMGAAMARNLAKADFDVRAWNRTRAKAEPLAVDGVTVADHAADAVRDADVVITMLYDAAAVQAAMAEAADGLRTGQVWAQMSTVGVTGAAELGATAEQHGLTYVDAPVLGTRQPAEEGKLIVLASGPEAARPALDPVFAPIAAKILWVGPAGDGSRLKLVANSYVLALTNAAAEAIALAEAQGLDPALFVETMAGGPLDSPYLQAKAAMMLARDFPPSFGLANVAKDARLIVEAGRAVAVRLDVAEAGAVKYERGVEAGHGGEDIAAVYHACF